MSRACDALVEAGIDDLQALGQVLGVDRGTINGMSDVEFLKAGSDAIRRVRGRQ